MPKIPEVQDTMTHCITHSPNFATTDARFDHIYLFIQGPLPPSNGFTYLFTCVYRFTYLFTCVYRFTCWIQPIPIANIMAETVADAFVAGWVARFGVPSVTTTDRGGQLQSHL